MPPRRQHSPDLVCLTGLGRLLTVGEVAGALRCADQTVLNLIYGGQLRAFRIGPKRGYRVSEKDVERLLLDRQVDPTEPTLPTSSAPRVAGRGRSGVTSRTVPVDQKLGF